MIFEIGGLKTLLDIVLGLRKAASAGAEMYDSAKIHEILIALRTVYFPSSGTLAVLEKAARGDPDTTLAAAKVLPSYINDEPIVENALVRLSWNKNFKATFLSIEAAREMDAIAYGKINVRLQVHEILQKLADGSAVDRSRIAEVVNTIKQLNAAVVALDQVLQSRGS